MSQPPTEADTSTRTRPVSRQAIRVAARSFRKHASALAMNGDGPAGARALRKSPKTPCTPPRTPCCNDRRGRGHGRGLKRHSRRCVSSRAQAGAARPANRCQRIDHRQDDAQEGLLILNVPLFVKPSRRNLFMKKFPPDRWCRPSRHVSLRQLRSVRCVGRLAYLRSSAASGRGAFRSS